MRRPLQSVRPLGPVFGQSPEPADKNVMGVSGTPMPNRPKNRMFLIYKLDGDHITVFRDLPENIQMKINARQDFPNARVKFKRSGPEKSISFNNQAVIVEVPRESIPFTDSAVHRVEDIIERAADSFANADVEVSEIFIEQG